MSYENNNEKRNESIFSKRLKAGKRRTYFFDVRSTKSSDYFVTITESVKKFNEDGYDRHKIYLYKEDFNKFVKALSETVDHVKVELMPDFDFDAFNHEYDDENPEGYKPYVPASSENTEVADTKVVTPKIEYPTQNDTVNEQVDKW